MGFLFKLLGSPVTAPTSGLMSIFRIIHEEVERERDNPEALKEQLIELQQLLDAGEISEEEYEDLEEDILDKLDALYEAMYADDDEDADTDDTDDTDKEAGQDT